MPDSESAARLEGHAALSHFLLSPGVTHLNHGSYGALPKAVALEQDRWHMQLEADPTSFFQYVSPGAIRDSAATAAAHFGGAAKDWVFCENATAAVNSVLASLPLEAGDTIATTSHAYGAVMNAMRIWAARRGARVNAIDLPLFVESDDQVCDLLAASLAPETKLLVIDHITSATALLLPVARIVEAAHRIGIPVLVDGAHAPGQIALDVPALKADWYTGNAHKWLFAPKGCGLLWTAPQQQAVTRPTVLSHGAFEGYTQAFDWIGTRDVTPWLCLQAAATAHAGFGGPHLMARNKALSDRAAERLAAEFRASPSAPAAMRAAMASLAFGPLENREPAVLRRRLLEEFGLVAPVHGFGGQLWVRISAQVYNEEADYSRLATALAALLDR
ncbi:MAG TPA: aminotransferase class V-fold PLP-dependent enzyme [Rhizomicrobium sp.]|jgi:isopenicillin-N epimerase|nr:aminotransferase class V-fold PLP-dependent enzyme [Rhizomicrobium sp.]